MIDSVANLDFISRAFQLLHQLKIHVSKNQTLDLALANGSPVRSTYETCDIKIKIGSYCQTKIFTVIDIIDYDLILGRPWLYHINPHLNWRANDVRFYHMGQSVFSRANADWETEKWMAKIPDSVTELKLSSFGKDDDAGIFVINVRLPMDPEKQDALKIASDDERIHQLVKK
jgi:hypothetical protein